MIGTTREPHAKQRPPVHGGHPQVLGDRGGHSRNLEAVTRQWNKVTRILVVHMAAQQQKQMVHMRLDRTLLKRLEDFRLRYHLGSRTAAARWLLEAALDLKLSPKKE